MACEPRIRIVPPYDRSAGGLIIGVAGKAGIQLDAAQQAIVTDIAGIRKDGKWSAFQSVIFQPRQNGKTEALIAVMLAELFVFGGRQVVFSAHQARTTSKVFGRTVQFIESSPQLGGRIRKTSNRLGGESITLTTGQTLDCVARSTGSGRGFSGDLLVYDEAQTMNAEQLAASLPMLSTRPNPHVIFALSTGNEDSVHLGALRERALSRQSARTCWLEWSLNEGDRLDDHRVWAACNPAYPGRISMEYMQDEYDALGPEQFAKERLGKASWPSDETGRFAVITKAQWEAAIDADGITGGPVSFGVAVTRESAAIVICGPGGDGLPVLEVAEYRPGDGRGWVRPRLAELTRKRKVAAAGWDDQSQAGQLGLEAVVRQAKARVVTPKAAELAAACGKFEQAFKDGSARHDGDPRLTAAVGAARPRTSGGVWFWDERGHAAEVLQAATWALNAQKAGTYDVLKSVCGPTPDAFDEDRGWRPVSAMTNWQ